MKAKRWLKRIIIYLCGLLLIAIGINISKIAALGISPVSSIPYAFEKIWGVTLGVGTYLSFLIFIAIQILMLRRRYPLKNFLGLAIAFVFSMMVDLTGIDPNAIGHLLIGLYRPETYIVRLLYVAWSTVTMGAGVFLYIRVQLVPLPSDGVPVALSIVTGKKFGDCKSIADTSMAVTALILQLIFLGGLASFTNGNTIVREGTIIASLLVGQVVKVFSRLVGKKIDRFLELD